MKVHHSQQLLQCCTVPKLTELLFLVENAILLAWFLNRTLLMPRALFGQPFGWMPFDRLLLEHQLRDDSDSQVQMCLAHDEELDLLENHVSI
jgi:hypothetical protein